MSPCSQSIFQPFWKPLKRLSSVERCDAHSSVAGRAKILLLKEIPAITYDDWVVSRDVSEALLEATAIREISTKIQESARK